MSACISSKGEYSSHTTTEGNFICDDCGVLDEDGLFAERDTLRAERDRARSLAATLEAQLAQVRSALLEGGQSAYARWGKAVKVIIEGDA